MGVLPISKLLRQTIPHTESKTVHNNTQTPHSSTTEITTHTQKSLATCCNIFHQSVYHIYMYMYKLGAIIRSCNLTLQLSFIIAIANKTTFTHTHYPQAIEIHTGSTSDLSPSLYQGVGVPAKKRFCSVPLNGTPCTVLLNSTDGHV